MYGFRRIKIGLPRIWSPVETRVFNQAIKRNKDSFPKDFMFQLTSKEWSKISSSQIVMMKTLPKNRTRKYLPYAFTEHGVSMAASVLKSPKARKMNIAIVRAFVALKKFALEHRDLTNQLEELPSELYGRPGKRDTQLAAIFIAIENLLNDKTEKKKWEERPGIGFRRKNEL